MQGLQIFDAGGNVVLDVTDRLTRVLGEFETGTSDGFITDTNLDYGTPWFIAKLNGSVTVKEGYNSYYSSSVPILISFNSQSLSWSFSGGSVANHHIVYGVY
jgi:hypothetical protein